MTLISSTLHQHDAINTDAIQTIRNTVAIGFVLILQASMNRKYTAAKNDIDMSKFMVFEFEMIEQLLHTYLPALYV
jgi:hypothetical protein